MKTEDIQSGAYPMELGDYWAIVARRKYRFLVPFVIVLAIGAALAFLLPPVYRSEATILIERQTIPSDIIESTVTGYVQERIEQIRQRIVTYDNLLDIARQYGIRPELQQEQPGEVVQHVRDSIEVEMVDIETSDPDEGGQRVATIAFTVAFSARSPETAQAVTQDLTERFLAEHKQAREAQARQVASFLEDEAQKLEAEIAQLEQSLAAFKQAERNSLPELMDMNLRLYEQTGQDIQEAEERIRAEQDQIEALAAELSLTSPYRDVETEEGTVILTGSERLAVLTAEYLRALGRYTTDHPDVIRLSREIRILAQQTGGGARVDELMSELVRLQEELRQARQTYSPDHPEVARLERSVASVSQGFKAALAESGQETLTTPPNNPRYVALETQLDQSRSNLRIYEQNLASLNDQLAEYERRLFQTPIVERDFKALSRDYDNALKKYDDLKNKQLQARLAIQLESGSAAQKFTLTSEAHRPKMPESPNRIGIVLLSGLFAFCGGIGSVTVAEYTDKTVRGARMILEAVGAPPLAIIPRIEPRPAARGRAA